MNELKQLARRFREEGERYAIMGLTAAEVVCREHAESVENALREVETVLLAPDDASHWSGYSKAHLRALAASGKLRNWGKTGAPLYRRSELPRRPPTEPIAPVRQGHGRNVSQDDINWIQGAVASYARKLAA